MNEFLSLAKDGGVNIAKDEPLAAHSTMRVGGKAKYAAFPTSEAEFIKILEIAASTRENYTVIGGGSNVVFSDDGYDGVVIFTKSLSDTRVDGNVITAECGVTLPRFSAVALENSLSGAEFLSGIPGTVGGGVYMNSGAYGKSIGDLLISGKCYEKSRGIFELDKNEFDFSFRHSALQSTGAILISAKFALSFGQKEEIENTVSNMRKTRTSAQPLEYPSAGSVFLPCGDVPAWKYVDGAGLRGFSVGGAEVSQKHAGFIINKGGATSADIKKLVEIIKNTVKEKYGVTLKTEIIFI